MSLYYINQAKIYHIFKETNLLNEQNFDSQRELIIFNTIKTRGFSSRMNSDQCANVL